MRVVAFAPSLSAVEEDAGGVNIKGFPMTSCYVDNFPAQITVPPHVSLKSVNMAMELEGLSFALTNSLSSSGAP
jgi:hypothetical protein